MFDINMYNLSDLPNKITYCNWRIGMVFNRTENYLTTIILSILFLLARWATIEMQSWVTAKRTPWYMLSIPLVLICYANHNAHNTIHYNVNLFMSKVYNESCVKLNQHVSHLFL